MTRGPHRGTGFPAISGLFTVAVVLLLVLAAGFTGDFSADPVIDGPVTSADELTIPTATATPSLDVLPDDGERLVIPGDIAAAALVILLMIVLALLARFLGRLRSRPVPDGSAPEQTDLQEPGTLDLVADALPAWARAAETALASDDATSDVVIRCWLEFERRCARAGVGRRPTQTTSDFAAAASAALTLPEPPLVALNRLYQQARFGHGVLLPRDRALAATSVAELAAALAARTPVERATP